MTMPELNVLNVKEPLNGDNKMNTQSEQINELMGALSKAQGQMKAAIKDSSNPHFKSRYADLASVWEACREPLASNGLAVIQTVVPDSDHQMLVTLLGHSSGQWIKSFMTLPLQRPGPQELGSCLSYCRRYGLAAMVGVFQDDDDGEKAESRAAPRMNKEQIDKAMNQIPSEKISEKQADDLWDLIEGDMDLHEKVVDFYKIKDLGQLPLELFDKAVKKISLSKAKA